jgi:nitroimidazol reductase NimA-like FMN-containing flavoprotein (pyridoxamine 5'-phosphate oxidase superfamily)
MIEVEDMSPTEISAFLSRVGYGHLACCRNDRPYVIPIHFAFEDGSIYVYSTEGKKAEIINANPNICLQVEDVRDDRNWESVIVDGVAELIDGDERDHALKMILAINPTLTPAVSIRWMDEWVRENIEAVYKIKPTASTGRRAVDRTGSTPFVPTAERSGRDII